MNVRKFTGTDERKVLAKIREELGPEAVVLHSVVSKPRGLMRLFRRPRVEIVAGGGFHIVRDYANGSPIVAPPTIVRPAPAPAISPDQLRREIAEIKEHAADVQECFNIAGVSDELARSLVEKVRATLPAEALSDRRAVREALREAIKSSVHCADGITLKTGRCVRVAFVGPTGVGKTTTIAKLISIYAYRGRSVAVITTDTYRIAAAEQIKRVAQLVGVPLRVAHNHAEIESALAEFAPRDLVLIDTAGQSPRDSDRIEELSATLRVLQADEIHLVLSSTTGPDGLVDAVKRFLPCGFNKVVLTKMDEAVKAGLVLDVLSKFDKELSFITTGQEIPRDIEIADRERLASLILGEEAA